MGIRTEVFCKSLPSCRPNSCTKKEEKKKKKSEGQKKKKKKTESFSRFLDSLYPLQQGPDILVSSVCL